MVLATDSLVHDLNNDSFRGFAEQNDIGRDKGMPKSMATKERESLDVVCAARDSPVKSDMASEPIQFTCPKLSSHRGLQ